MVLAHQRMPRTLAMPFAACQLVDSVSFMHKLFLKIWSDYFPFQNRFLHASVQGCMLAKRFRWGALHSALVVAEERFSEDIVFCNPRHIVDKTVFCFPLRYLPWDLWCCQFLLFSLFRYSSIAISITRSYSSISFCFFSEFPIIFLYPASNVGIQWNLMCSCCKDIE